LTLIVSAPILGRESFIFRSEETNMSKRGWASCRWEVLCSLILLLLVGVGNAQAQQGWHFRVGDRVECDYLRGDGDWRAGTVTSVDGTFVTVQLDDGHSFASNAGDPSSSKWFRPLPGTSGRSAGAGTSGAQFKVGDRVEADPLQIGQFKPATVVAIDPSGFYVVDIDNRMQNERCKVPMRTPEKFIRPLAGAAPAPHVTFPPNALRARAVSHPPCALNREHMLAKFLEYETEIKQRAEGFQDVRFVIEAFELQPKRVKTYLNPAGMVINTGIVQQPVKARVKIYAERTLYDGTKTMRIWTYPSLTLNFFLEAGRCAYETEGAANYKME